MIFFLFSEIQHYDSYHAFCNLQIFTEQFEIVQNLVFTKVLQRGQSQANEGRGGKFKTYTYTYEVGDFKSEKSVPMYCFKGTPLHNSTWLNKLQIICKKGNLPFVYFCQFVVFSCSKYVSLKPQLLLQTPESTQGYTY